MQNTDLLCYMDELYSYGMVLSRNSAAAADLVRVTESLEYSRLFCARFSRSRKLLHFIADRVLEGTEHVEEAIRNCFFTAYGSKPEFKDEGVFRSWLLRVLIDEAVRIRYRGQLSNKPTPTPNGAAL
jgi:hypothetical protein